LSTAKSHQDKKVRQKKGQPGKKKKRPFNKKKSASRPFEKGNACIKRFRGEAVRPSQ